MEHVLPWIRPTALPKRVQRRAESRHLPHLLSRNGAVHDLRTPEDGVYGLGGLALIQSMEVVAELLCASPLIAKLQASHEIVAATLASSFPATQAAQGRANGLCNILRQETPDFCLHVTSDGFHQT